MDAAPDGPSRKRPFPIDHDDNDDDIPEFVAKKQRSTRRLKSAFESIFEKYGRDFSGVGDEVDLETGELVVDNGHLEGMVQELDNGATSALRSPQAVRRRGRTTTWSMWAPKEVKSRAIGYMTSGMPAEEGEEDAADDTSDTDDQSEHEFQEELLQQIRTRTERQQTQDAAKISPYQSHGNDDESDHSEPLRYAGEFSDGRLSWTREEVERLIELRRRGLYFSEMQAYFVGKKQAALAQKWRRLLRDKPDLEPKPGDLLAKALAEINAGRLQTHHTKLPFRRFSQEEDDLLVSLRQQHLQFIQMVPRFSGRDEGALCRRFRVLTAENPELRALLGRIYHPAQPQIEERDVSDADGTALPTKGHVLSKRYHATLDPWTAEEDSFLLILARKGVKFDDMSSFLKDRSGSTIKSRWFKLRREGNADSMLSDDGRIERGDNRRKSAPGHVLSALSDVQLRSHVPRARSEDAEYKPARVAKRDDNFPRQLSRSRRKSSRLQQASDGLLHAAAEDEINLLDFGIGITSEEMQPSGYGMDNVAGKNEVLLNEVEAAAADETESDSGELEGLVSEMTGSSGGARLTGRPRECSLNHVLNSQLDSTNAIQTAKPKRGPGRPRKLRLSASDADDDPSHSRTRHVNNAKLPPPQQYDRSVISGGKSRNAQITPPATAPRSNSRRTTKPDSCRVGELRHQQHTETREYPVHDNKGIQTCSKDIGENESHLPSLPAPNTTSFASPFADVIMDTDHETSLSAMPSSSESVTVHIQLGRSESDSGGRFEHRQLHSVEVPLENDIGDNNLSGRGDSIVPAHTATKPLEQMERTNNKLLRNGRGPNDLLKDTSSSNKRGQKRPLDKRRTKRQIVTPSSQMPFRSSDANSIGARDAGDKSAQEKSKSRHVSARKSVTPRWSLPSSMSRLVSGTRTPLATTPQSGAKARTASSRPRHKTPLQHVFRRSGLDAEDSSEDELCTPGGQPARSLIMT